MTATQQAIQQATQQATQQVNDNEVIMNNNSTKFITDL